ncbi:TetR/AcrR family transcriptional regulator [Demequina sp.]|uniref:TetR/AcrR family transcriptional regulator n=1 Tax=Demequina sp. TaxID=2050685 RepID=UPI003D12AE86
MADGRDSWRNGPEAAQLRREFREQARALREELREEWVKEMAKQQAQMQAQREEREREFGGGARRGPGRPRGNLSRDAIVDVAMRIMQRRGLDKVTMRAVAHELNTGPASLYAHVGSMAELHGHMLDRIVGDIDLTVSEGTWRERIALLLRDLSEELLKYPDLARSALEVRPIGDNTLRFADHLMGLLAEGGIDAKRRAHGLDMLMLWTMAGAAEHAADAAGNSAPDATIKAFREAVGDAERYPHLAAVQDELFLGSETSRFAWGVDALLTGIATSNEPGTV